MPKERIAVFAPSMKGGGMERVTLAVAKGIADRGHPVDLLLVSGEGPFMSQIPDNIHVVDFATSRALNTIPGLIRYLRENNPEAMLCAMEHIGIMAVIAKLLSFTRTKVFVVIHNTVSQSTRYLPPMKRRILRETTRILMSRAKSVVGVSQGVVDDFEQHTGVPKDKLRVVFNPVVTPQLKQAMGEPVEHKWLQEKSIPVVLAAGHLQHRKGFDVLIQAFYHVKSQKEARLIIIGEGDQRETLTELIQKYELEDHVNLHGFVDNPYAYMKQADLFVLSSRFEGLPTVIIEAMACGCPVVSTDCPSGPREILNHGEYGKLVPVENPEALAEAILQSLSDEHDLSKLEERTEQFEEKRIIDEYLSLLLAE